MNLTGVSLAALGAAPLTAGAAPVEFLQGPATGRPEPDLVVVNAKVYTMDTRQPRGWRARCRRPWACR